MQNKIKGSKKKIRKPHPQPAHFYWFDVDGCWACQNKNNCGNCKMLKKEAHFAKEKIKRQEKNKLKTMLKEL